MASLAVTMAAVCLPLVALYYTLLSRRLRDVSSGPTTKPRATPSKEELDAVAYENIDMMNAIPPEPTHCGYAVIGGSGFVGLNILRLLLLRGETSVRVLDMNPPPADILAHPAIEFVKTNMTSLSSTQTVLAEVFNKTGKRVEVVYHVAATIRFWERASYTWTASKTVNVDGTKNILASLPSSVKILVYTSTGDLCFPRPKFKTLGIRTRGPEYYNTTYTDEDAPLGNDSLGLGCYVRSKKLAEKAVLQADKVNGVRTGALRPGCTIIGLNDRLISSTLIMPRFPVFDSPWSSTPVDVQDVAAAHLQYEHALRERPDEVSGKSYIISGKDPAMTNGDIRAAIQHYSSRPLIMDQLPVVPIFILAHMIEAFLWCRYHILYPFCAISGRKPSLLPRWMGEAVYLQPTTLDYFRHVVLDSSRAQKEIGYRPQWGTLQSIKHVVESFESGKAGGAHGLQLGDYK